MRKPPFSRRRMMNKPWYAQMTAQDTTAVYRALGAEIRIAAERLMAAGWSEDEAYRLTTEASELAGAGFPGWEKVKVVQEALNA
jgi:hypothetical protein